MFDAWLLNGLGFGSGFGNQFSLSPLGGILNPIRSALFLTKFAEIERAVRDGEQPKYLGFQTEAFFVR